MSVWIRLLLKRALTKVNFSLVKNSLLKLIICILFFFFWIGKPKTPKKEVTSKIASLWKKVEESKKKEKNVKDNRVWITAEKEEAAPEEVLIIEKEEILELASGKIVRSSTFQGLGDGSGNSSGNEEPRYRIFLATFFLKSKWLNRSHFF